MPGLDRQVVINEQRETLLFAEELETLNVETVHLLRKCREQSNER